MGKVCEICGKGPDFGQSISHSHKSTKKKRKPNLHRIKVKTESGEQRLWVCTRCIRSGVVKKAL
ncbi:50S ribosomal protein L28 [bacterium]|nr:50S ribosomal protein L28 [bacterium]